MIELITDATIDTLKLLPYLFVTFLILEFIEHKLSNNSRQALTKHKKIAPIVGGLLGTLPQCGFAAMAANLYSVRVITMGTLIAIFLSTSDEMLPILLSEQVDIAVIVKIILLKILIAVVVGLFVDFAFRRTKISEHKIKKFCQNEHCNCEHSIIKSSLKHTAKTGVFILLANFLIGVAIYFVGIDTLENILKGNNILVYFGASLVGLIPNCAASVMLTEVYLSGLTTFGTTMAGLLTSSGVGILLLFKSNKSLKENCIILATIYGVGVIAGLIIDLII